MLCLKNHWTSFATTYLPCLFYSIICMHSQIENIEAIAEQTYQNYYTMLTLHNLFRHVCIVVNVCVSYVLFVHPHVSAQLIPD
jgi:hypothetical protein